MMPGIVRQRGKAIFSAGQGIEPRRDGGAARPDAAAFGVVSALERLAITMAHNGWQDLLGRLADAADAIALRYFRHSALHVDFKSDRTPVTQADREIEDVARHIIGERHPELGVLGEEYGEAGVPGGARLIIDPIDGTQNYARGIPIFATLLAIEERGDVVAGMVSAPALATRWFAVRGGGAFRNGERIHVSRTTRLEDAQLFHAGLAEMGQRREAVVALAARAARSRGFGDFYQDVLIAEGAGEVAVDFGIAPWDIAPLLVIVEEAGGRATSVSGERTIYAGDFISSNGLLHDAALGALARTG
jgi:histidinol-phosphatase